LKPSEILKKLKKTYWTTGAYWKMSRDYTYDKFCFNGFIMNETLGYPEPKNGDIDINLAYGFNELSTNGRLIHDIIADINDSKFTFTWKKKTAIAFLEREGL
jgi:hypothetical protein